MQQIIRWILTFVIIFQLSINTITASVAKRVATSDKLATISSPILCSNGKKIDGQSGIERILTAEKFCKMFPIWSWKYPVSTSVDDGSNSKVGINGGVKGSACEEAAQSFINDLACTQKSRDIFSKFANRGSDDVNAIEIAAFMAHINKETGGLGSIEEAAGSTYCDTSSWNANKPCSPSKSYSGRGFHQISWNYNYFDFSNFWFNESDGKTLLQNPELILKELELAIGSALWFWFTPRDHNNLCSTTRSDVIAKTLLNGYGFGDTISIINGGIECPVSGDITQAQARIHSFLYFLGILNENALPQNLKNQPTPTLVPRWVVQGCPAIDTSCQFKCKSVNGPLTASIGITYPTGWSSGWTGNVMRFVCTCDRAGSSPNCGTEVSGGQPSNKSEWPWSMLSKQNSDDEHKDDEHKDDEHKDDEHKDDEHKDDEHKDDDCDEECEISKMKSCYKSCINDIMG